MRRTGEKGKQAEASSPSSRGFLLSVHVGIADSAQGAVEEIREERGICSASGVEKERRAGGNCDEGSPLQKRLEEREGKKFSFPLPHLDSSLLDEVLLEDPLEVGARQQLLRGQVVLGQVRGERLVGRREERRRQRRVGELVGEVGGLDGSEERRELRGLGGDGGDGFG